MSDRSTVASHIKQVGQDLCDALQALADQVPAKSKRPQEFARTLKVHRTLAGRLLSAIRTDDPLAAISRMPRSEGLRRIIQAAKVSVPRDTTDRAEEALRAFENTVQAELGGWDGFEAAITEWLPDARERFELASRQLVFKGTANLLGMRADAQLDTTIFYPSADGEHYDIGILEGVVNLTRLRPSVRVPIAVHTPNPRGPRPLNYEIESTPDGEGNYEYQLLEQFCSRPCPKLDTVRSGDVMAVSLAGHEIGAHSAVDVFAGSVVRSGRPLYSTPGEPPIRPQSSASLNVPAKVMLVNVLVHEDIWPGKDPQLIVYDLHLAGIAMACDPAHELDRIDAIETVQYLGKGAARFRVSEVGRHVEMVQHICDQLGWNSDKLRGYRVRAQYPLLSSQYSLAFDPPPMRPADLGK